MFYLRLRDSQLPLYTSLPDVKVWAVDVFIYDTNPLERSSTSGNTAQIIDFFVGSWSTLQALATQLAGYCSVSAIPSLRTFAFYEGSGH